MRKENQGIRDAGQISRVPDFFVVRFSFFVVPGRGVLNTPHKRPDRGGYMFVGCPIFIRQGKGAKEYAPQTTRQGRSYLSIGRRIYLCGIYMGRMQYAPTLPAGDISIVIAIKFFPESILFLS